MIRYVLRKVAILLSPKYSKTEIMYHSPLITPAYILNVQERETGKAKQFEAKQN
jgi:hypothetical protein